MTIKLPVLISVPHGGDKIPEELKKRTALSFAEIFEDGDALTRFIYNFRRSVAAYIDTDIARAFIDLNRAPDDRPPRNPDGVVKTETVNRRPVYRPGCYPDDALIERLLSKYYLPYHEQLDNLQQKSDVRFALDCHSMLPHAPLISKPSGVPRPLICLSNRGDVNGHPTQERGPVTCPPEWIQSLAECFRAAFAGENGRVAINDPFYGGYITQKHYHGDIPWIQVEINRKLYLSSPWFDSCKMICSAKRIQDLQTRIFTAIKNHCLQIGILNR